LSLRSINNEELLGEKLKKAFGKGEKMFKAMIPAIPGLEALTEFLLSMADATGILEPFKAVLDVIMGLFGVMGAQIIPVLMDAIRPLLQVLIEMTPVMTFLGKIIALVLSVALIPFTLGIQLLYKIIKPFMPFFEALIPLIESAMPIINLAVGFLTNLIDMISPIDILKGLFKTIKTVAESAAKAIEKLIGWIKDIANTAGKAVGGATETAGSIIGGIGEAIGSLFGFQEGTHYVPATGIYMLHKGEEVKPSAYSGRAEEALEELVILQKKMLMNMEISNMPVRRKYE